MPTVNNNTPTLRFPEFKGEWELKKLGEVANFKVTNSFSRENLNYENGVVKNIHYGDIHTKFQTLFDITKEIVPFINEEISINRISDDFYCKEGDIIFADASEDLNDVGKSIEIVNLNNEKLLSGLHTLLARPIEKTFKIGFNGFLFKSNNIRLQIQKESQGSKVLSINVGRISGIKISFPTLPEQQKIATFLTTVDEKLQALKQKKSLLEQYRKGVMQKIFSQELRFKDDNGNTFADWEEKMLGDVCKTTKSGGTPISTKREYYNGDIPFLSISDMTSQGKYLNYTSNHISKLGLDNSASWVVPAHSIIYSMYASIGFVAINNIPLATSQAVLNLILKEGINTDFIYYTLVDFQKKITQFVTTGTQGNLNAQSVRGFKIQIPSLKEQTKIATFLSTIDEKINQCQAQITNTEVWKKGLLQGMFV